VIKLISLQRTELFLGKPENEKPFMATVPMGRGSSPKDVAEACCYLGSDAASFITGIEIPVDGGRCV
jgi:NAD(P)-dependent dehydrogenase (short-subunit alcohol dehydrogenase family)